MYEREESAAFVDSLIQRFENEDGYYRLRINESHVNYYNLSGVNKMEEGRYVTAYNFSYPYIFKFEEDFDPKIQLKVVEKYYWLSYFIILLYLVAIFSLQKYMRNRAPFQLKSFLFAWNIILCVFSVCGFLRIFPESVHVVQNYGFKFTLCFTGKPFLDNRVGNFWIWMFTFSKFFELGDTVFIVLRKQPLIFLHWYHHVTVLLYAWHSYYDYVATARWFVSMNFLIHSAMYGYYAMKSLKFKIPRFISMSLTVAQLSQMVLGVAVNIWAYQIKQVGNECHVSYKNINISFLMYASYFVLFFHFFTKAYLTPRKKSSGSGELFNRALNSTVAFGYEKGKLE